MDEIYSITTSLPPLTPQGGSPNKCQFLSAASKNTSFSFPQQSIKRIDGDPIKGSTSITTVQRNETSRKEPQSPTSPNVFRSPSHRKSRMRTLEVGLGTSDVASTIRMRRNTDSMLEDAIIADRLRRRLGSRRRGYGSGSTTGRREVTDRGLADFIMGCLTREGTLDAVSAARPTSGKIAKAADLASKSFLEGYFQSDSLSADTRMRARQIFLESLVLEEYDEGEVICRQNDVGDKIFVIEEGVVQLVTGGQVVGTAGSGSILGELSLVYGIRRDATVKVETPCVLIWSMDALSFRRVQALVASESLKATIVQENRTTKLKMFKKKNSSLLDLQEQSHNWLESKFNFKSMKKVAIIGQGTFGSVHLVTLKHKEKNKEQYYALKCMSKASVVERKNEKRVLIEKNILKELSSPFVIKLFGTHQDISSIYFVTDFVQGGNLMTYMIRKDILDHSESMFFTANILSALIHMHDLGFVHRDVKPENCLLDRNGFVKLCDFGMAKRLPSVVQLPNGGTEVVTLAFTMCGTPEFMAPEFVLSTGYTRGVDHWALGCILTEMYTGRSPFEFDGDLKSTFREVCMIGMGRKGFTVPGELWVKGMEEARGLAQGLLTMASKRLGRENGMEIREHPYFGKIDFDDLYKRKIPAPYVPKISHASDVSYFEKDTERISSLSLEPFEGDDSWCKDF